VAADLMGPLDGDDEVIGAYRAPEALAWGRRPRVRCVPPRPANHGPG
jgi:hypothetical protein